MSDTPEATPEPQPEPQPVDFLTQAFVDQIRDLNLSIVNMRAELAQVTAERDQWRSIAVQGGAHLVGETGPDVVDGNDVGPADSQ